MRAEQMCTHHLIVPILELATIGRVQANWASGWGRGNEGSQHVGGLLPPAGEYLSIRMTDLQRAAVAKADRRRKGNISSVPWLNRDDGLYIINEAVEEADDDAAGVDTEAYAQRFQGAFFCAPHQGDYPSPLRRGGSRNHGLFFVGKIVGDKCIAVRLYYFQITTQVGS